VLLLMAVAVQTTLFARLRPLDAAPALVVLTMIGVARHLPAEDAVVVGFLIGVLQDLLVESPLGLWALTMATVAFVVARTGSRIEDDPTLLAPLVFLVSLGALALFALLGTIFGEKTLADGGVLRKMILPAAYNLVLAIAVLPAVTAVLGGSRRSGLKGFDL
jgi:rod shape-determining protein MreD